MSDTIVSVLWQSSNLELEQYIRSHSDNYQQCLGIAILGRRPSASTMLLSLLTDLDHVCTVYCMLVSLTRSPIIASGALRFNHEDSFFVQVAFYKLLLARVRDVAPFSALLKAIEERHRLLAKEDFIETGFAPDTVFSSQKDALRAVKVLRRLSRRYRRRRVFPLIEPGSPAFSRLEHIAERMLAP